MTHADLCGKTKLLPLIDSESTNLAQILLVTQIRKLTKTVSVDQTRPLLSLCQGWMGPLLLHPHVLSCSTILLVHLFLCLSACWGREMRRNLHSLVTNKG